MIICSCNIIKEEDIIKAKKDGAKTIDELAEMLNIDWSCCRCSRFIEEVLLKK